MSKSATTLLAVGDISPNRDDPPSIFRHCADVLRAGDVTFGQLEAPLSDRGMAMFTPALPCKLPAKNISALARGGAGFDIMSFASNHAVDYGYDAFNDTLDILAKNDIAPLGAGNNIAAARAPVIIEKNGVKIGFLGYLSIVFPGLVADDDVPGCAPLRSSHYYKQVDFQPGTPPLIVTELFPEDKKAMVKSIEELRPKVDVLVVSMHCGVHHVPSVIAMYQKEAARAAIDAGADLILQHHAHILKGVEVYKGKAIFYGLGNFATEHTINHKGTKALRSIREYYGVKPTPGKKYDFLPDSRKTMIAKAYIENKKIAKVTYIPAYINTDSEPEIITKDDPRSAEVFDYVLRISEEQKLDIDLVWDGDEVRLDAARPAQ